MPVVCSILMRVHHITARQWAAGKSAFLVWILCTLVIGAVVCGIRCAFWYVYGKCIDKDNARFAEEREKQIAQAKENRR